NGNWFEREGEGLTARCFCHEIDHLEGILFTALAERMLTEEEIQSGEY
ncbi:MAG: peptide deformylase, partial [Oscillospiraceae bacterium]|nr:peptide deformylase [Oscillospiraceae bacterium]